MDQKLLTRVSDIVVAHLSSNSVSTQDVPNLIKTVYESLAGLGGTAAVEEAPTPAMSIKASVKPDSIGCLECGKRFKSITRHLMMHDMTPDQYRAKWSLPKSYSMVSAEYSAQRTDLAKASGLGKHRLKAATAPAPAPAPTASATVKKRGRPAKVAAE